MFDYCSKKILITGGGGYLGGILARHLGQTGAGLVLWSNSLDQSMVPEGAKLIRGSFQEESLWKTALEDVDIVFHLAAQTGVKVAEADIARDLEANYFPVMTLGAVCKSKGFHPFVVLAGTATQYGIPNPDSLPVDESFPDKPMTAYDLHKCMAEQALLYYVRSGCIEGASLRLSNIYGPGPESSSNERGILNLMVRKALRGEPLTLFGDGDYVRDYIFIEDVIHAFRLLPEYMKAASGQSFILATGVPTTLREAAETVVNSIQQHTGRKVEVRYKPLPPDWTALDGRRFIGSSKKLTQTCGWIPKISFEEGVQKTVKYFSKLI